MFQPSYIFVSHIFHSIFTYVVTWCHTYTHIYIIYIHSLHRPMYMYVLHSGQFSVKQTYIVTHRVCILRVLAPAAPHKKGYTVCGTGSMSNIETPNDHWDLCNLKWFLKIHEKCTLYRARVRCCTKQYTCWQYIITYRYIYRHIYIG